MTKVAITRSVKDSSWPGPCAFGAQTVPAAPLPQPRFLLRQPRPGEFFYQLAQRAAWQAGADTMRQGRAGHPDDTSRSLRGRSRSRDRHAATTRYAPDVLSRTKS